MAASTLSHNDYTVVWICALPLEMAAAKAMLDETHGSLSQRPSDHNTYTLGRAHDHNVVIACLPSGIYGTISANSVLEQILGTFQSLRFSLMVGIGGGVPTKADIRLGDVVVSKPTDKGSGVIQYDYGKTLSDGCFQCTAFLNKPPQILLTAVSQIESDRMMGRRQIKQRIFEALEKNEEMKKGFSRPGSDQIFHATYPHQDSLRDCSTCDPNELVPRKPRATDEPFLHYGLIASGNQVMKDAQTRDKIAEESNILCFEMEAAGLMDRFPCLVIRGICDYCDSHKQKQWQGYAALAAAAYAKLLLSKVPMDTAGKGRATVAKYNEHYHVPHNPCSYFTGREHILTEIEAALLLSEPRTTQRREASNLTRRYRKENFLNAARFWGVFWLNASSVSAIRDSFVYIALKAGLKPCKVDGVRYPSNSVSGTHLFQTCDEEPMGHSSNDATEMALEAMSWLANLSENWLLIIDNADDPKIDVCKYCPSSIYGNILITTRNRDCRRIATAGNQEIAEMSVEDGITLLLKVADKSTSDRECRSQAQHIAERLGYLALALVFAGAAISEKQCELGEYLDLYARNFRRLMSSRLAQGNDGYQFSVYTTWEISRQTIADSKYEESAQALEILDISASLHFPEIPEMIFNGAPPRRKAKSRPVFERVESFLSLFNIFQMGGWHAPMIESKEGNVGIRQALACLKMFPFDEGLQRDLGGTRKALVLLNKLSLINFNVETKSFSMHRLVHEWTKDNLDDENRQWSRWAACTGLVYAATMSSEGRREVATGDSRRCLASNLSFFLSSGQSELPVDRYLNAAQSRVASRLAMIFSADGKYGEAEELYRESLVGMENSLSKTHPDTLVVIDRLAIVLEKQCQYDEAAVMNRRAIDGRTKLLGERNPLTLESINNLAVTLEGQGDYSEAEKLNRMVLQMREEVCGIEMESTIQSVNNLASNLRRRSSYAEATELFTRAYEYRERNMGGYHPDTMQSLSNLALSLDSQGLYDAAAEKSQEALIRRTIVLGKSHPDTLINMSHLALILLKQGDIDNAEKLNQEALRRIEGRLGPSNLDTLTVVSTLAGISQAREDYQNAERLYHRSLVGFRLQLPPNHPHILRTLINLAVVVRRQTRYGEAEILLREAMTGFKAQFGMNHQDTLICLTNLAIMLENQGKLAEAESTNREALWGFEQFMGKDHPDTLQCLHNLAGLLQVQGKYDEAEGVSRRVVEGRKARLGPDKPKTLQSIAKLAHLLHCQRRYPEASELYEKACAGFKAAGIDSKASRTCSQRFSAMQEEIKSVESTFAEGGMHSLDRIGKIGKKQKIVSQGQETAPNMGIKRRRATFDASVFEDGKLGEKRLKLTADTGQPE
ncbi:hypothetical protein BGW36DRAFT_432067 [Talaromyces proteolyticus]|uniref:Nucleoside phosphorylase domain-containing protein n=1 Tax=Talaromyces proteolyticus TaxID=1131652 RepID=A0AAD4KHT4_9EURO|nr:uncharacterized protein BGW36DRAFT_432067 [Talaromyces proteolyticus]KAH8691517.1 hypothetical protein BGW36DRAFT_432067 [Talaromyces proteolyticus]